MELRDILYIISLVSSVATVVLSIVTIIRCMRIKKLLETAEKTRDDIIEHTNVFIEYVKNVIVSHTSIAWSEYKDGHKIEMLTREQLKNLAEETATKVHQSINLKNIDYSELICNKSYINWMIVHYTMLHLKSLADHDTDDIDIPD